MAPLPPAIAPALDCLLFLAASALMVWRLEKMAARGVEGTVLGTLVMPYCSGVGNLIFVYLIASRGGPGGEVLVNCLVNNVTNLTLLIGLPALFTGLTVVGRGKVKRRERQEHRANRLSLCFTLAAVLFFTGALWALGRDGRLDGGDGLVLVGLFLFWQCFHVYEVLKGKIRQDRAIGWGSLLFDGALLAAGTAGVYISIERLVAWLSAADSGFFSAANLGWLSGWLMVLPNASLAFYYAWRGRADVVYASQVGDGHICIPLCIGLFACFHPIAPPAFFQTGIAIIAGATLLHLALVATLGRVPRILGLGLVGLYAYFVATGLVA